MTAPDTISILGPTASFYNWFTKFNSEVIGKLNKMYIYNAKAGDGITLQGSTANGGFTFAIDSVISKGITFTGAVRFNNTVTFPAGTQISSASRVFTGNFLSGACLGSVVRITSTGGITRAQSNDRTAAEALGIVTTISPSSSTVTFVGEIAGTSLTTALLGSGVFSTGCVYFLSPSTPGRVTVTEPTTSGQVSKPILIATSATGGIVLPFRGQYIDLVGVSGACGEGLDTIVIPITSQGDAEVDFGLRPGSVMAVSSASKAGSYNSPTSSLKYRKANFQTPVSELLGVVSSYIGPYSTTTGDNVYLLVQPIGSVVNFDDLGWSSDLRDSGYIYIDSIGNPTKDISPEYSYSIGTSVQSSFIFSPIPTVPYGIGFGSGSGNGIKNHFVNGSLSLWQRRGRGDISGVTWTSGETGGYFADRWCIINTFPSGQTFNIVRKDFVKNQIDVAGYPEHYFNLSGTTVGANNTFYIENRTEDARRHAGKEITFSFYAKAPSSQSIVPYIKQYGSTYDTPTILNGATLTVSNTTWTRYYRSFTVPIPTGQTFDTEGYFAVGLKMGNSTVNVDFAQFMLEDGKTYSTPEIIDLDDEYRKSAYYYQRSYAPKDVTGLQTQKSLIDPAGIQNYGSNGIKFTLLDTFINVIPLKHRMRRSSYFSGITHSSLPNTTNAYKLATVYSPTGVTNDAYNLSANTNLKGTQGVPSAPFLKLRQFLQLPDDPTTFVNRSCIECERADANTIKILPFPNSDGSVSSILVNIFQGAVMFDDIIFHYVIDLDLYQGLT